MGSTRVELPGGNWAELRDPMEVTEKERRPLKRAYAELAKELSKRAAERQGPATAAITPVPPQLGGTGPSSRSPLDDVDVDVLLDAGDVFERQAVVFCVTSWGGPRLDGKEITPDGLDDIPAPVYTALSVAVAPIVEVLFPNPKASIPSIPHPS